jgi:hypothetical protein
MPCMFIVQVRMGTHNLVALLVPSLRRSYSAAVTSGSVTIPEGSVALIPRTSDQQA